MRHLLIALFAGLCIYLSLELISGPSNQRRYSQLEHYAQLLEGNIEDIGEIGEELEARYYQLRDDPMAIVREANRIGMLFPDQVMIQRLDRQRNVESLSPGQILSFQPPGKASALLSRIIALCCALLLLILLSIFDSKPPKQRSPRKTVETDPQDGGAAGVHRQAFARLGSVGSDLEMGQSIRVQIAGRE